MMTAFTLSLPVDDDDDDDDGDDTQNIYLRNEYLQVFVPQVFWVYAILMATIMKNMILSCEIFDASDVYDDEEEHAIMMKNT